jgi:tetratricopeptide (TPR) repeat protein
MKPSIILCASLLAASILCGPLFAGYYEQGTRYYVFKKYDKAREMFLKAVEASDDGNSYYFLGEIEKNEGNFEKALEYYRSAVEGRIQRKYLDLAYWNIIILLEHRGDYEEMVGTCRELYERLGDAGAKTKVESLINKSMWTEVEEARRHYQRGMDLKGRNRGDEAQSAFRDALTADSSFLAPRFEMGLYEFRMGNAGEALHHLQEVARRIPYYGEVHLLLGDMYLQKGHYREALIHLDKGLQFGFIDSASRNLIRLKKASTHYELQEYESARKEAAGVLKKSPRSLDALLLVSAIDIKEEKYQDALKNLEKARKISPDNPEILFQIGSIHYRMNNPLYVKDFDRLFEHVTRTGGEAPQKYYKAFTILLKHRFESADFPEVVRIYESLPEQFREYESTILYARAQHRLGNNAKAVKQMEKLYLRSDDDRYLMCLIYAESGMADKAKSTLLGMANRDIYLEKARKEPSLKKIAKEIEDERVQEPGIPKP